MRHWQPWQWTAAASALLSTVCIAEAVDGLSPLAPGGSYDGGVLLGMGHDDELLLDAYGGSENENAYEPAFAAFGRDILGRATSEVVSLTSDTATQLNLDAGASQTFLFSLSSVSARQEGNDEEEEDDDDEDAGIRRRANETVAVYLSANTCMQPQMSNTSTATTKVQAPQLTAYVSTSSDNTSPGPDGDDSLQTMQAFIEGALMMQVDATDSVYITIAASNVSTTDLTGIYNFQVAVSTTGYYHTYDNDTAANLIWVDSDGNSALMMTHNLTNSTNAADVEEIMDFEPYVMFAQNTAYPAIDGVKLSYCGLSTYAQISSTDNGRRSSFVATSMTRRGAGNLPKQQFYFSGLNSSASYVGILVSQPDNGSTSIGTGGAVGGGGHVTRATAFSTKTAYGNCEVIFNLTFCNETAYAVPGNVARFANATLLAQAYDEYAANMYSTFEKVIAQVACELPPTQRYSLARGCDDCRAAYKNWLCSVAIPRCSDITETDNFLQPRALSQAFPNGSYIDAALAEQYPNSSAFNSSRNPFIDETIYPGPYKEVLPCDDLCFNLVQSCPSEIGFGCPMRGAYGYNTSYGRRTEADSNGAVTCNYPGSAHYYSAGPAGPAATWLWLWLAVAVAGSMAVL